MPGDGQVKLLALSRWPDYRVTGSIQWRALSSDRGAGQCSAAWAQPGRSRAAGAEAGARPDAHSVRGADMDMTVVEGLVSHTQPRGRAVPRGVGCKGMMMQWVVVNPPRCGGVALTNRESHYE